MQLPHFELERFLAEHEFSSPYVICASDCQSISLKELMAFEPESRERLENLWLGYTEPQGHPKLREAIAALYKDMTAEQIVVHAGAGEGIFTFMNTQLKAGDHVIVQYPCYQSLFQVAETIGCEITKWTGNPEKHWELDLEFLKSSIKQNTKAVIVNMPHNPTGYLMDKPRFEALISILRAHNLLLFCDEVYRGLEYDPKDALPAACDAYENAVSLGVLSKAFGLAGLRIGWLASRNKKILDDCAAFKDYTSICASAPSELLSEIALRHQDKLLARNKEIIFSNLTLLDRFFERHSDKLSWQRPIAGCIAFANLKTGSVDKFVEELREKTGVLLAPGTRFGYHDTHFRIGFGRSNFIEGLSRLNQFLS